MYFNIYLHFIYIYNFILHINNVSRFLFQNIFVLFTDITRVHNFCHKLGFASRIFCNKQNLAAVLMFYHKTVNDKLLENILI